MAAGELVPVRPTLSMDNSGIAQACKEAWRVVKRSHHRIEFAATTAQSPHHYTILVDFSKTTFFLNHGNFSFHCISAMTPDPISTHVRSLAIVWSSYRDIIDTCKRLTLFRTLQQLVILIPPELGLRIHPRVRAAITTLDLYLQGKVCQVCDPLAAGSQLRALVEEFLLHQCPNLGPEWPTIEVVIVPGLV